MEVGRRGRELVTGQERKTIYLLYHCIPGELMNLLHTYMNEMDDDGIAPRHLDQTP